MLRFHSLLNISRRRILPGASGQQRGLGRQANTIDRTHEMQQTEEGQRIQYYGRSHLPSEFVDALQDLVTGSEPQPGKEANVFVYDTPSSGFLEDYLFRTVYHNHVGVRSNMRHLLPVDQIYQPSGPSQLATES